MCLRYPYLRYHDTESASGRESFGWTLLRGCLWGLWDRSELFMWLGEGAVRCCWLLSVPHASVFKPVIGEGEPQTLRKLFLNKLAQKAFAGCWGLCVCVWLVGFFQRLIYIFRCLVCHITKFQGQTIACAFLLFLCLLLTNQSNICHLSTIFFSSLKITLFLETQWRLAW